MLSVCIVICVSFGSIQTASITYNDPFYPNYDSFDYNEIVRAPRNLTPKSGLSESLFLKSFGGNRNVEDANGYRENNDIIRLPTLPYGDVVLSDPLPRSSYFDHGIQETLPLDYGLITQNVPSQIVWNSKYLQTPYEIDQDTYEADQTLNAEAMNVESDPYEVDLYPFVHTSLSAALNPVPPVHSLPPVHATQVHETMPSLDTRGVYDIDVLNPENAELMSPNLRITRSRREDYLDQLTHDGIMNNILPTMPIPFVRGAESSPSYQVPQQSQTTGSVRAMYPTRSSNRCALPILLGCSPNMFRGTMSSTYADRVPQEASKAYREDKS